MNRAKFVLIASGILIALIACSLPLLSVAAWVGFKDVEISFVVRDAVTGQPVPNAEIGIRQESGGLCNDRESGNFSLNCDGVGRASHLVQRCMCYGKSGYFVDSFGMHLPHWWYRAEAPGYDPSEESYLDDGKNSKRVQRGQSTAKLEVIISLHRTTN